MSLKRSQVFNPQVDEDFLGEDSPRPDQDIFREPPEQNHSPKPSFYILHQGINMIQTPKGRMNGMKIHDVEARDQVKDDFLLNIAPGKWASEDQISEMTENNSGISSFSINEPVNWLQSLYLKRQGQRTFTLKKNLKDSIMKNGGIKLKEVVRRKSCHCSLCGGISCLESKTLHLKPPKEKSPHIRIKVEENEHNGTGDATVRSISTKQLPRRFPDSYNSGGSRRNLFSNGNNNSMNTKKTRQQTPNNGSVPSIKKGPTPMSLNRTPKANERRPSVFSRVTEIGTPHASENDPGHENSNQKSTEHDNSIDLGRKRSSLSRAILGGQDYVPSIGRITPRVQHQASLNGTPKKQEFPESPEVRLNVRNNELMQPKQLLIPKDRQQGSLPVIYSADIVPTYDVLGSSLMRFGKNNGGSLSNKTLNNPDLFSLQNAGRLTSNNDFSSKKSGSQRNSELASPTFNRRSTPDLHAHFDTRSIQPKVLNQTLTPIKAFRPLCMSTRNTPRASFCGENQWATNQTKPSSLPVNTARPAFNIDIPGMTNIQKKVRKLLKKELSRAASTERHLPKKKEEQTVPKDLYLYKLAQQIRENMKLTKVPKVKKPKDTNTVLKGKTVFSEILRPGPLSARSQSTAHLTPLNSLYNVFPNTPNGERTPVTDAPKSSRRERSFEKILQGFKLGSEQDPVMEPKKLKRKKKKVVTKSKDIKVRNISTSGMTDLYLPRIRKGTSQDSRV